MAISKPCNLWSSIQNLKTMFKLLTESRTIFVSNAVTFQQITQQISTALHAVIWPADANVAISFSTRTSQCVRNFGCPDIISRYTQSDESRVSRRFQALSRLSRYFQNELEEASIQISQAHLEYSLSHKWIGFIQSGCYSQAKL
ncbi:Hypothetical_protein [Hexamita inflata]|uniref:Hypothetical_protein n=1 Tax=Hexamita inflata TaxID=28002 RepID=A0AA86QTL7_9EUKA|nr:Hypothetical protein HINF_LOCUS8634 [Hexamita inflata]CAI9920990.1 Hypothetical protein HINF_LOCUS8635 [Hexamita inflata]CAI9920992.1 Hypothetical protein HINF_LOCUS8637 [Hexamita inflata]CAI9923411.1 Hypothetical protein HINF_LOCUS11056 [Hexamita inflata]CAI9923413.1 Hypothetical protein HINF_LOCUS11058 [Hexamita inflata]